MPSSTDSDELYIGFDGDRNGRQHELNNRKNQKGKYQAEICLGMLSVLQNIKENPHAA